MEIQPVDEASVPSSTLEESSIVPNDTAKLFERALHPKKFSSWNVFERKIFCRVVVSVTRESVLSLPKGRY